MSACLKGPTQQVGLQSFQVDDLVVIGVGCVKFDRAANRPVSRGGRLILTLVLGQVVRACSLVLLQ